MRKSDGADCRCIACLNTRNVSELIINNAVFMILVYAEGV
jgi:hypothetical protein